MYMLQTEIQRNQVERNTDEAKKKKRQHLDSGWISGSNSQFSKMCLS